MYREQSHPLGTGLSQLGGNFMGWWESWELWQWTVFPAPVAPPRALWHLRQSRACSSISHKAPCHWRYWRQHPRGCLPRAWTWYVDIWASVDPQRSSERMSVGWCSHSGSFILGNATHWWLRTETKVSSIQRCNKRLKRRKIMLSFTNCFQNENETLLKFPQMQTH